MFGILCFDWLVFGSAQKRTIGARDNDNCTNPEDLQSKQSRVYAESFTMYHLRKPTS